MNIQRYQIYSKKAEVAVSTNPEGNYVKYKDAVDIVARLEAEIARHREIIKGWEHVLALAANCPHWPTADLARKALAYQSNKN